MRGVQVSAFVFALVGLSGLGRGGPPPSLPRDPTCEEQCQAMRNRDDAACDADTPREGVRDLCHEAVRARHDVCLRICED
jgi:hypothetical protein